MKTGITTHHVQTSISDYTVERNGDSYIVISRDPLRSDSAKGGARDAGHITSGQPTVGESMRVQRWGERSHYSSFRVERIVPEFEPVAPEAPITLDLTPTIDGYSSIAEAFIDSVVGNSALAVRENTRNLLGTVIQTAGYLGENGRRDLVMKLVERAEGKKRA